MGRGENYQVPIRYIRIQGEKNLIGRRGAKTAPADKAEWDSEGPFGPSYSVEHHLLGTWKL